MDARFSHGGYRRFRSRLADSARCGRWWRPYDAALRRVGDLGFRVAVEDDPHQKAVLERELERARGHAEAARARLEEAMADLPLLDLLLSTHATSPLGPRRCAEIAPVIRRAVESWERAAAGTSGLRERALEIAKALEFVAANPGHQFAVVD